MHTSLHCKKRYRSGAVVEGGSDRSYGARGLGLENGNGIAWIKFANKTGMADGLGLVLIGIHRGETQGRETGEDGTLGTRSDRSTFVSGLLTRINTDTHKRDLQKK